tara:strand:- start:2742 stop:3443 length:702 start_codon:yes stop_codon:yes gene_type:complete
MKCINRNKIMKNKYEIKEIVSRYLKEEEEEGRRWVTPKSLDDENTAPATLELRNRNRAEMKRRVTGPSRPRPSSRKPNSQKDWTEYEGPSLSEQAEFIARFLENTVKINEKDFTSWAVRQQRIEDALKRQAEEAAEDKKKKKPQKDWTEYEGPSLSEQADYIDWFLEEGKRLKAAKEVIKGAVKKIFKRKPKDDRTPDQKERDQRRDAGEDLTGMGADGKTDKWLRARGPHER